MTTCEIFLVSFLWFYSLSVVSQVDSTIYTPYTYDLDTFIVYDSPAFDKESRKQVVRELKKLIDEVSKLDLTSFESQGRGMQSKKDMPDALSITLRNRYWDYGIDNGCLVHYEILLMQIIRSINENDGIISVKDSSGSWVITRDENGHHFVVICTSGKVSNVWCRSNTLLSKEIKLEGHKVQFGGILFEFDSSLNQMNGELMFKVTEGDNSYEFSATHQLKY